MRLALLAAGLFLALSGLAAAQPYETPQDLLTAFYEPYFTDDFYEDETRFRSAALQALYDEDVAATPEGELGALSFDPYIDGQDYELADFAIGTPEITGDRANVLVSFTNFGQPRRLVYELVREEGGWKIDDVVSTTPDNEYRLSEIFAESWGE